MTALSYTLISFPGLGLELDPPSTIQLGPLTIHFYGLIIAVGSCWRYCTPASAARNSV